MTKKATAETKAPVKSKAKDKEKAPDKSKDKAKVDPIKLERVNESVKHNFVDDELITFGYSLGQKYRAIRTVQAELKSVKADYTAREKSLEADIDEISGKLNAGFEMRTKECFKIFDYKIGIGYWFLCDDVKDKPINVSDFADVNELLEHLLADEAFEPIKQRPIRDHERQAKLFDEQAAADGGDDPPGGEDDPDKAADDKQTVETS